MAAGLWRGGFLLCCMLAAFAAGRPALAGDAPATRTVSLYGETTITLPGKVERVAIAWPAQNSIVAMLGFGDKIVATTSLIRDMPIFRQFVPSIKDAALASMNGGNDVNVEQMMTLHPDILFVPQGFSPAKKVQLENAGIAVAALHDNSMDALVERTVITGQILGGEAEARALRFKDYFEKNKARVAAALSPIPPGRRLKVYLASAGGGTSYGSSQGSPGGPPASRHSLNQDWMDLGGAINIAENWAGGSGNGTASVEAVIAADPDVVITMRAADAEAIRHDPQWKNIKAVRNGRVYANPRGMFYWCRETSEEALQFLWLAKTLYPDALPDVDMHRETKAFYKDFYGYELTDAEVNEFLSPTN